MRSYQIHPGPPANLIFVSRLPNFAVKLNKRPNGINALLGHLLIKRIPVMYKLGNTRIPEYLSEK